MFYSPVIFESLSSSAPFFNATVIAAVFLVTTLVGVVWIDRWGRRPLLLQGGIQMMLSQASRGAVGGAGAGPATTGRVSGAACACHQLIHCRALQVAFAIVLSEGFKGGATELDNGSAIASLVLCCVFVAGFAWSWGPIVWVLGKLECNVCQLAAGPASLCAPHSAPTCTLNPTAPISPPQRS